MAKSNIINSYSTQEDHDKFLLKFKDRADFLFHPEEKIIAHFLRLDKEIYVKDCMIGWIEASSGFFTKKEMYLGIGLQKQNEAFEKFWNFLKAPRSSAQYMAYDKESKNWVWF